MMLILKFVCVFVWRGGVDREKIYDVTKSTSGLKNNMRCKY